MICMHFAAHYCTVRVPALKKKKKKAPCIVSEHGFGNNAHEKNHEWGRWKVKHSTLFEQTNKQKKKSNIYMYICAAHVASTWDTIAVKR